MASIRFSMWRHLLAIIHRNCHCQARFCQNYQFSVIVNVGHYWKKLGVYLLGRVLLLGRIWYMTLDLVSFENVSIKQCIQAVKYIEINVLSFLWIIFKHYAVLINTCSRWANSLDQNIDTILSVFDHYIYSLIMTFHAIVAWALVFTLIWPKQFPDSCVVCRAPFY